MRLLAIRPLLALSAIAILSAQPAAAASDPDQGERIAQRWCAACHIVAENQKRASADVPSFFDIAKRKTNGDLTSFLTDPHPKMPDMRSLAAGDRGHHRLYPLASAGRRRPALKFQRPFSGKPQTPGVIRLRAC